METNTDSTVAQPLVHFDDNTHLNQNYDETYHEQALFLEVVYSHFLQKNA